MLFSSNHKWLTLEIFGIDVSRYFGKRIDPFDMPDEGLATVFNLPSPTIFVSSSDDIRLSTFGLDNSFGAVVFDTSIFSGCLDFTSPFFAWTVIGVDMIGAVVFALELCTFNIICLPKSVTTMRRPHAYADCRKLFVSSGGISSPSICNVGAIWKSWWSNKVVIDNW